MTAATHAEIRFVLGDLTEGWYAEPGGIAVINGVDLGGPAAKLRRSGREEHPPAELSAAYTECRSVIRFQLASNWTIWPPRMSRPAQR